jgi:hypothetical protein
MPRRVDYAQPNTKSQLALQQSLFCVQYVPLAPQLGVAVVTGVGLPVALPTSKSEPPHPPREAASSRIPTAVTSFVDQLILPLYRVLRQDGRRATAPRRGSILQRPEGSKNLGLGESERTAQAARARRCA